MMCTFMVYPSVASGDSSPVRGLLCRIITIEGESGVDGLLAGKQRVRPAHRTQYRAALIHVEHAIGVQHNEVCWLARFKPYISPEPNVVAALTVRDFNASSISSKLIICAKCST